MRPFSPVSLDGLFVDLVHVSVDPSGVSDPGGLRDDRVSVCPTIENRAIGIHIDVARLVTFREH